MTTDLGKETLEDFVLAVAQQSIYRLYREDSSLITEDLRFRLSGERDDYFFVLVIAVSRKTVGRLDNGEPYDTFSVSKHRIVKTWEEWLVSSDIHASEVYDGVVSCLREWLSTLEL